MAKLLYLTRHAEAVDKSSHQTDKDRELTPVGVQQSFQIGAYLSRENFIPDIIFSSDAERARLTASLAAETMKFDTAKIIFEEELYNASVRTFFGFLNNLDDAYQSVMCIGHNPVITYLAEYLTKAEIGDISPAGMVIAKFEVASWSELSQGNGELLYYLNADQLAKI